MRIVDELTRKMVMQNRIDALEADNLFDTNFLTEDPDDLEDGEEEGAHKEGGYNGEYMVEDQEDSEDISDDADAPQMPDSKAKAKRTEKTRQKALKKQ